MWTYRATLIRVIDADTYVLDIDLGFCVHTRQHIRLLGLDCPEIGTAAGQEAAVAAREWFAANGPEMLITTSPAQPKTFDRWVAKVGAGPRMLPGMTTDLADYLRAGGHVKG